MCIMKQGSRYRLNQHGMWNVEETTKAARNVSGALEVEAVCKRIRSRGKMQSTRAQADG